MTVHIGIILFQQQVHLPHIDNDECEIDTHNCDENANCTDTPGSYTCVCNTGYDGNGFNCTSM